MFWGAAGNAGAFTVGEYHPMIGPSGIGQDDASRRFIQRPQAIFRQKVMGVHAWASLEFGVAMLITIGRQCRANARLLAICRNSVFEW